ncbi:hypothetical protein GOP47_0025095 [Adiantum capillus-veneris]|uniref:Glutaredoxin domain-containing protein n=1 Tax=Adiantum capillus-veneris TaxID=13818 RepID=A0A9D4U419_ADICA|nr:hypothetical protein GOP47_0025095 [Adiantum capillus-veneris]
MGCTTSKQGFHGRSRRENVASWYNPLPRSILARPNLHNPPECEPSPDTHIHSSDEDPAIAGSFIRLLHRKKSLSPSADHHHHHHTCYHHPECMVVLNPSTQNHPHAMTGHHDFPQGDDYGGVALQLQMAKLDSSTHKKKLSKTESNLAMADQAPHLINESAVEDNVPFFRFYPERLPPPNELCSTMAWQSGDKWRDDDDGDEHMHVQLSNIKERMGLRHQRKSRFAPKPTKAHHVKSRSTEKSLSFNVALDDGFTEMGSPAWPRRNVLEEQSILSTKKRKNSSELSATNIDLDGLAEQYCDYKFCDRPKSNAEHIQIKGFSEVQSLNIVNIESNELSLGTTESSAFNAEIPGGSQLNTPFRSPSRSPALSSLKSSSSPLFDPSILAAFEEAVESVRYSAPDDGWMLVDVNASNEPSSLSSSDKFTWVSSEPSSDEESARHSDEIFASNLHHDISYLDFQHEENELKRQKLDGSIFSGLDQFELRCPPKGEDKIVLYFTSLRGVRKTYQDCCALRLILQGLGVDVDERDVWMHLKFREELAEVLGERGFPVPRLFIKGRYIGGVEEVKQLHEDGLLVRLVEDLPTFRKFRKSCDGCADVRFIPCLTCSGSCKLLDDELDEMVKCFECNENGLIMCPICSNED